MNPSVTVTSVGTAPVLVFSGTGKARFRSLNGNVRFGTSAVDANDSRTWLQVTEAFNFCSPAEVYAITASGTDSATVEVWY